MKENKNNKYITVEDVDKIKTNEFNDATLEYIDIEEEQPVIEEEPVQYEDFETREKRKKIILIIFGILILLALIFFIIRGCVLGDGKLTNITINTPDIIYVEEETAFNIEAKGKRNLKNTTYKLEVSDSSIVELENKDGLKGNKVSNSFISFETGKFLLSVKANLGSKKIEKSKEIAICKHLTEDAFGVDELTAIVGKQTTLALDLGESSFCYSTISFNIKDSELVRIDDNNYLFGLKEGKTTITFKSEGIEITKTVNIVEENKLIKATSLSLNKTSTSIYIGYKEQLKATLLPDDVTNKNLIWTSSNNGVVSVSNNGLIKGISKGVASITVTTEDKLLKAEIKVIVKEKTVTNNSDKISPKLTKVTIYSNNNNRNYARIGDRITLEVLSNEILRIKPTITINEKPFYVTCIDNDSNTSCYVTLSVTDYFKGLLNISIKGYKDMSLNTGEVVTNTTDRSFVFVDNIYPECDATLVMKEPSRSTVEFKWSDNESGLSKVVTPSKDIYTYVSDKDVYQKKYTLAATLTGKNYSMSVTDMAGNNRVCTYTVIGTDISSPTISITSVTPGANTATITAKISDNEGVVGYAITNSTTIPTTWTNISSIRITNPTFSKGTGDYYIHAIDEMGNTSNMAVSLTNIKNNSVCPCNSWHTAGGGCMVCSDCGDSNPDTGCFLKGTVVLTPTGYKNIEQMKKGDAIISYNTKTGKNEVDYINHLIVHGNSFEELYLFTVNSKIMRATGAHPFFVKENNNLKIVIASKLKVGDMLVDSYGKTYPITKISHYSINQTVYNLSVKNNHTYYVTKDKYLVHNEGEYPEKGISNTYNNLNFNLSMLNSYKLAEYCECGCDEYADSYSVCDGHSACWIVQDTTK